MTFLTSDAPSKTLHNTSNDVHAFYIPLSVHLLPDARHEATNFAVSSNSLPLLPLRAPQYHSPNPCSHTLPKLVLVSANEIRILTSKPNARQKSKSM